MTTSKHMFEFLGKSDSLVAASKSSQKALTDTDKTVTKTSATVTKLGDVAKVALAGVGVAAVGAFVTSSVKLAVAAEDAGTKFEAVFGPNVEKATEFVDGFANKAGFAEHEMKDMLATTANVASGLGATGDEALDLSTDLATIAGDVASFNGATSQTPAVLAAMQSALTGEREALKTYGIVINEADVQTQAFIETGKTQADQLTQVEKAQATLTLITERAGAAVGDLDATADGTSNTMARLSAEFKDVQVQVGTALIPTLGALLGILSDVSGAMAQTADGAANLENNLIRGLAKLAQFADVNDDVADSFLAASDATRFFNEAIETGTPRFEATAEALAGIAKKGGPDAENAIRRFAEANGINNLQLEDAAQLALEYKDQLGFTSKEIELLTDLTSESTEHTGHQAKGFEQGRTEAQEFARFGLQAVEDAQIGVTEATDDTRTSLQKYLDLQRAAVDPLFAYTQSVRDLEDAEVAVDVARRDFGKGSAEHVAAMEDQTAAYGDMEAAAETLKAQGLDPTKDAFRQMATQAGLTDAQIRLMEEQWDLWNPKSKQLELTPVGGGWTIQPGGSEFRAEGGPVRAGKAYVVGEGGEPELFVPGQSGTITPFSDLPASKPREVGPAAVGVGGGFTVVVNFNGTVLADRHQIEDIVVRSITQAQQRGRLPKPDRQDVAPVKRHRTA